MRELTFLSIVFVGLVTLACAGQSANPLSPAAQEPSASFYVENHGNDARNLHLLIADTMRQQGLQVTSGARGGRPDNVTYIVSYTDRWAWDMRTYLARITIEARDSHSGAVVADSTKHQGSLAAMGKSFEEIIAATTTALFTGAP